MTFNIEEEVRKLLREKLELTHRGFENAIIKFFGSHEEVVKRIHLYVIEEAPAKLFPLEGKFNTYALHTETRFRLKTEDELLSDRKSEIARLYPEDFNDVQ